MKCCSVVQACPTPLTGKGIDVLHYTIQMDVDWEQKQAKGLVTISLKFNESSNQIELAASELKILSVCLSSQEKVHYEVDTLNHRLIVHLSNMHEADESLHITIAYETQHINETDPNAPGGSFGKGIRFFEPTAINPIRRKQCWTQSELFCTSYWLPCHTDIADLSTTDFTATVDKGLQFITNGELTSHNENPDGTTTYRYTTTKPYPIYLAAFVAGEYTALAEVVNGVQLNTWCYPDEVDAAMATTERFDDMLRFLEEKTGFAYPFKKYTQVMVQDYPFPGLTGQNTFSIISDNMIDDFGTHRDFLYLWDGVAFNALASQWFGNVIVPEKIEDFWLTKSFAQYFEGRFTAEKNDEDEYLLWYHPWETANVFGDWQNGNRHPIVPQKVNDPEQFASDSYCKFRGSLVLRMLEKEIGEEHLLQSIQEFVRLFAFQPVETRDFQNTVERVSQRDLDWFFDQWIYRTGHPVFQIKDAFDQSAQTYQLEITQVQEQDTVSDEPFYFSGHIALEIDGKKEVVYIEPYKQTTFNFSQEDHPLSVYVNSEDTWICEIGHERTLQESLHLFASSKDAAARQTALNELVAFAQQDTIATGDKEAILEAFREVIGGPDYWRLRYNVIGQMRFIQPIPSNHETLSLLRQIIDEEHSWVRAAAISSLGTQCDTAYADLYIQCFEDISDRVRNAAALALGKTKSPWAYDALIQLSKKSSWKNQSLMHCLSGLAQLGDPRGEEIALNALQDVQSPRWFLGNGWDYPFVAVQTLSALEKKDKALDILLSRFNKAMEENNKDDIFYEVLLIATLKHPRGIEIIEPLKKKFANDSQAMSSILKYEEQLRQNSANN
ncbi:MAG: M1 family aminopeptidase [Flavobacteriales bacterium]